MENALLARINALIVATEFLVPNISVGSRSVVVKWLKADLAALEQLRKQVKKEEQREGAAISTHSAALAAIIQAKYAALSRLDKKRVARPRKTVARMSVRKNGSPTARST